MYGSLYVADISDRWQGQSFARHINLTPQFETVHLIAGTCWFCLFSLEISRNLCWNNHLFCLSFGGTSAIINRSCQNFKLHTGKNYTLYIDIMLCKDVKRK